MDGLYSFLLDPADNALQVTVFVVLPPDTGCDPPTERITVAADAAQTANFSCFGLTVDQVLISPESVSLLENRGGIVEFAATVLNDRGTPLTTVEVRWELVDPAPGVSRGEGGEFVVSDQTPAGEFRVEARADDVVATAVIQVVRIAGDLYYSTGGGGVRQVFLDRLNDPVLPEQLWVNPEGNILHLAVNQSNGTVYFAQGIGGGALIIQATPDGQERFPFTANPGQLSQTPAVDPQTGRLFFSRLFGGSQDIYRADADGFAVLRITAPGGGGKLWPAVSPDGTRLAWSQDLGEGNTEIFTSSSTGANPVRFTAFAGADIAPYWISNDRLAWTRDIAEGNAEVMAAGWPAGVDQEILTLNESGVTYPGDESQPGRSCHPGTVLVRSDQEGKSEVFVLDDGSGDSGLRSWLRVASADADIASAAMRCR